MKRKKFIIAGTIVIVSVALLSVLTMFISLDFYETLDDFVEKKESMAGRIVRLRGIVEAGSVVHDGQTLNTKFTLIGADDNGKQAKDSHASLRVSYTGALPNNFEPGRDIVVQGAYEPQENLFSANQLMFKCPSKYEGEKQPVMKEEQ